jgi:hypothetical protein
MSHGDPALTPRHRLRLARPVVDGGWPIAQAAAQFNVLWPTVSAATENRTGRGN